ncbi:MAG: (Fe-S)-binding protein [Candidatus Thermoplasmatota archaeon]
MELIDIIACTTCGKCRVLCPVFEQTFWESMSPRGKVMLSYGLEIGELKSKDVLDSIYKCTNCKNCEEFCSSNVKILDIILNVRRKIFDKHKPHGKEMENILNYNNPFGEKKEKREEFYIPRNGKGKRILYIGCVPSYQDMKMVQSAMKLLDKFNIDYITLGKEETCCGYIAYLAGCEKVFRNCIGKNLEIFEKKNAKEIITICAGCYRTLKKIYKEYENMQNYEIFHISEYLALLMSSKKFSKVNGKVLYHDPCDLGRHMSIYEAPREVLSNIANLDEFKYNRKEAKCCGGGGGLKSFNIELSRKIAINRVLEANERKADIIATSCPACKSNLRFASKMVNKNIRVMDICEVLCMGMKGICYSNI